MTHEDGGDSVGLQLFSAFVSQLLVATIPGFLYSGRTSLSADLDLLPAAAAPANPHC